MVEWNDEWRESAACKGLSGIFLNTEIMGRPGPQRLAQYERAKAICAECPVQPECLEAGQGYPDIWGGLLEKERIPQGIPENRARHHSLWPVAKDITKELRDQGIEVRFDRRVKEKLSKQSQTV